MADDGPIRIEYRPLSDLLRRRHPRNPKEHALEALEESMERFGFTMPVAVDEESGNLAAGHGRVDALEARRQDGDDPPDRIVVEDGEWLVPTILGLEFEDPDDLLAYLVADNRLTEAGGWHDGFLSEVLTDLRGRGDGFAVRGTGLTPEDVELLIGVGEDVEADQDEFDPEPPPEPDSEPGEIYELGRHRLLCGDATDPAAVDRLMDGAAIACLWTDPPYGVEYEGGTAARMTLENDDPEGTEALLADAFAALNDHLQPSARFYIAAPPGPQGTKFRLAIEAAGWRFHQALVWVKDRLVLGHSDYHYRHEDILYGHVPGEGRPGRGRHDGTRWYGGHDQATVFEIERPARNEDHPTEKPVELVAATLRNSTVEGHIVADVFAGSGTTLVAAHQLGRTCYAMELDPAFCDVIRRRYARLVDDESHAP